jgi:ribosomal protein S18 acetylase RimI-like enzyme
MVWDAAAPATDSAPEAVALRPEQYPQALELAKLTNPGPFGVRTPELGEYFGVFEGDRLVAMAGERTEIEHLHEISGVCTHPDFQGKGLARRLTLKLVQRQMARGKLPFLHVMSHNPARALYEKMGFRNYLETVVRVITKI